MIALVVSIIIRLMNKVCFKQLAKKCIANFPNFSTVLLRLNLGSFSEKEYYANNSQKSLL